MKKIIYVDAETFEEKEQQFGNFHYKLIENIKNFIVKKYQCYQYAYGSPNTKNADSVGEIISNSDGNELMFGMMRGRKNGETIAEKYKITIEKISEAQI